MATKTLTSASQSRRMVKGTGRSVEAGRFQMSSQGRQLSLIAVFCLLIVGSAVGSVSAGAQTTFKLAKGDAAFWNGPEDMNQLAVRAATAGVIEDGACNVDSQSCVDYKIKVLEPAARLRVALDLADDFDFDNGEGFTVYLYDPDGVRADLDFSLYSAEVHANKPARGTWIARVVADQATDATFRMRAKLEKTRRGPTGHRALLPNLRLTPPFEFTFQAPATPFGSGPAHGHVPTNGCTADEIHDFGAKRCLRFSIGPENVGAGPLELVYVPGSDVMGGRVIQRVHYGDGAIKDVNAGRYEYHATHTHYHHAAFGKLQLFRVVNLDHGVLKPAGTGPKMGFCMADYAIVNWERFDNAPQKNQISTCRGILEDPSSKTVIGLSKGWADVYYYSLPGNYIEFGENGDGVYVVRVKANASDAILESTPRDNYSYALIRVTGSEIEVLERGYGKSPWDPRKVLANDIRYATAEE